MPVPTPAAESYQREFEKRWHFLNDAHVRDLAWLIDSPDLLDPQAPQWQGRVATLDAPSAEIVDWLRQLDDDPSPLHDALAVQPFTRLGRYAESLMAFYFRHGGSLLAHGVQVRAEKGGTIGEFDFLLRRGEQLLHWEFATKFYLLEPSGTGKEADYFVGPNLADTLGAKMRKIFDQQLMLAQHPAALPHLPLPLKCAQALIKGWLFYRDGDAMQTPGVSPRHCRGFWQEFSEIGALPLQSATILPRLRWLAPAKIPSEQALDRPALTAALEAHFAKESMPVMIAILERRGDVAVEIERGFVVPDDWRSRAGERVRRPQLLA
jgi:hypothetical protein